MNAVASATAIRTGEPLSVAVTATNETAVPLDVFNPLGWLEIRDAAGHRVASGRFGFENLLKLPPQRLEPSASASDTYVWSGERTDGSAAQISVGVYQLRAVVHVYGSDAVAYSDPITVAVTP